MLKYAYNSSCRSISPAPSNQSNSSNESNLSLNCSSSTTSSASSDTSYDIQNSLCTPSPPPPAKFANSNSKPNSNSNSTTLSRSSINLRNKNRLSLVVSPGSSQDTSGLSGGFSQLSLNSQQGRRRLSVSSVSSCFSVNSVSLQTSVLRIHNCSILRPDIQYKTMSVSNITTSDEVIKSLLTKCKVRFKDPRLFYLIMEVDFRSPNGSMTKGSIDLESNASPMQLMELYPKGQAKICLKMKQGRLVRVFDGSGTQGWQYKSIMISKETTAGEMIDMIIPSGNPSTPTSTNSSSSSLFTFDPTLYNIYIERSKHQSGNYHIDYDIKVLDKVDELMAKDKMSDEPKIILISNRMTEQQNIPHVQQQINHQRQMEQKFFPNNLTVGGRRGRCGHFSTNSTLSLYENHILFDDDSCFIDDTPEEFPIIYANKTQNYELTPPPIRWRSGEIFRRGVNTLMKSNKLSSGRSSTSSESISPEIQSPPSSSIQKQRSFMSQIKNKTSSFSHQSFFV